MDLFIFYLFFEREKRSHFNTQIRAFTGLDILTSTILIVGNFQSRKRKNKYKYK